MRRESRMKWWVGYILDISFEIVERQELNNFDEVENLEKDDVLDRQI